MRKSHLLLFILFIGCTGTKQASTDDSKKETTKGEVEEYYDPEYKILTNKIYDKDIKTVRVHKSDWDLSNPAIELKTGKVLTFSFDKLSENMDDYYYTIVHCNSDWKKSNLQETNYLEGFFQEYISNFKFSFKTYESYVHYEVNVPNKNLKIKETGNYIFKVFADNDPEQVVLTKRFIVYENKIITRATAKRPSNISERNYKQEIDFELDLQDFSIPDIQRDIKVVVQQNNRWDNAITDLKPLYIRGNQIIYDYDTDENVFDGGNEYRFLDIRNMRYRGQKVEHIVLENRETNVYMIPEEKRRFKNYLFYIDLDGKFIIRNQFAVNQPIESDYIYTNFILNYPEELPGGDVYVFGGLSDNGYAEEFKMSYNEREKRYEAKIFLKQGYYDYQFMFKKESEAGDITIIEGDHFETENMYTITTYRKDFMCNCDRVIGYYTFKSNQKL